MADSSYQVVKGDNLWKIAKRELGSGAEWPRLWRYNNRREVIKVTGRGIPNPDVIVIGQRLLVPRLVEGSAEAPKGTYEPPMDHLPTARESTGSMAPSPSPLRDAGPVSSRNGPSSGPVSVPSSGSTLSSRLPAVQSPISFKYRLEDLKWPPYDAGAAIVEVRMTGDVVLTTKKAYPALYVTSRGELEAQVTKEANHAFGKLVSDNRYVYDVVGKKLTMRSMLVSQSNTPNTLATAIGVEMSSNSPMPKLRGEFRLPKLEGSFGIFRYTAFDMKVVVEITPKLKGPPLGPSAQPIRQAQPVQQTSPASQSTDWNKVIGTGIIITAGLLVTATIIEDFVTMGAGTVDDPVSFAAASAALARGLTLVRGAVLPLAAAPASITGGAVMLNGAY
jgi:hypothetical protein